VGAVLGGPSRVRLRRHALGACDSSMSRRAEYFEDDGLVGEQSASMHGSAAFFPADADRAQQGSRPITSLSMMVKTLSSEKRDSLRGCS